MDPNAALSNARTALTTWVSAAPGETGHAAAELAEAFEALDGWLTNGGFLPTDWTPNKVPAFGVDPEIDKLLHMVFVTALEGGIGYWAESRTYHWSTDNGSTDDLEGFYSDIEPAEDDSDFESVRIDRAVIAKAMNLILGGAPIEYLSDAARAKYVADFYNPEDSDLDANDADNIVQIGLFGKVVFG